MLRELSQKAYEARKKAGVFNKDRTVKYLLVGVRGRAVKAIEAWDRYHDVTGHVECNSSRAQDCLPVNGNCFECRYGLRRGVGPALARMILHTLAICVHFGIDIDLYINDCLEAFEDERT